MLALGAVEPDGARVVDHDGKGWSDRVGGLDELEARLEASDIGHDLVDWRARLGEGSLGDGVVHWVELKLNHLSHFGNGVAGIVLELAVFVGDHDDVGSNSGTTVARGHAGRVARGHAAGAARGVLGQCTAREEERGGDGCEMHLDCLYGYDLATSALDRNETIR